MVWLVIAPVALAALVWTAWFDFRALLFLPVIVSVMSVEAWRVKKLARYDFLTLANLVFVIGYGIAPALILGAGDSVFYSPELAAAADTSDQAVILIAMLSTLAYWALVAGYRLAGQRGAVRRFHGEASSGTTQTPLAYVALAAFIIGSISYAVYAGVYGGVTQLLLSAALIRVGELEPPSAWVFLVHFTPLTVAGAWWCLWRCSGARTRSAWSAWLVATVPLVGFAVLTQAGTAGRLVVLIALASTLLAPYVRRGAVPSLRVTIPAALLVLGFIVIGKQLFSVLAWGSQLETWDAIFADAGFAFFREFTHVYLGIQHALHAVPAQLEPRWGIDVLIGLQWLMPGLLLDLEKLPSISHWNTELATGVFDSVVPPGLVGYAYYSFLLPGVLLVPTAYGFIMGVVENMLLRLWRYDAMVTNYYIVCALAFAYGVMNADPRVFLVSNFWVVLLGLGAYFSVRLWRSWSRVASSSLRRASLP